MAFFLGETARTMFPRERTMQIDRRIRNSKNPFLVLTARNSTNAGIKPPRPSDILEQALLASGSTSFHPIAEIRRC